MLIPKGVHVCLCSGGLGNGEELCLWGRWEAFWVLGVPVNFYSITGVSGRQLGQLGYPWRLAGRCQGGVLEGAVVECCGCLAAMGVGNAVSVWDPGISVCAGDTVDTVCWGCCRCWGWCLCVYDRPAPLPTAPEVVKGDPVGSAADVWGVGVLTYIM